MAEHVAHLPCKIGDKLWGFKRRMAAGGKQVFIAQEGEVTSMFFDRNMELILVLAKVGHRRFGESAFYTREEAEKALKGVGYDNRESN